MNQYYPMHAAELLDSVFNIYKKCAPKHFLLNALAYAMFAIISVVFVFILATVGVMAFLRDYATMFDMAVLTPSTILVSILIVVGYLIFLSITNIFVRSGAFVINKHAFYNQKRDFNVVFKEAAHAIPKAFTVFSAQVLLASLLILLLGIMALPFYIFFPFYLSLRQTGMAVLLTLFVILIFFVYALVATAFLLAIPVAVYEDKFFFSAIRRGFSLIKEDFWSVFGLVCIWTLVYAGLSYSLTAVVDVGPGIIAAFNDNFAIALDSVLIFVQLFNILFSLAVSFVISPLNNIFSSMVYFNQRIKHEGLDISIQLEKLKEAGGK